jgi:hypothetical protein
VGAAFEQIDKAAGKGHARRVIGQPDELCDKAGLGIAGDIPDAYLRFHTIAHMQENDFFTGSPLSETGISKAHEHT